MKNLFFFIITFSPFFLKAQYESLVLDVPNTNSSSGLKIEQTGSDFILSYFGRTGEDDHNCSGLLRTNENLDIIWQCHLDSIYLTSEFFIEEDGIITTAYNTYSNASEAGIYFLKLDSATGEILYTTQFTEGWENASLADLERTESGYFAVLSVPNLLISNKKRPKILKLTDDFEIIWETDLFPPSNENMFVQNVNLDSEGYIYYSGVLGPALFDSFSFAGRLDPEGNLTWSYYHNIPNDYDVPGESILLKDGSLLVENRINDDNAPWWYVAWTPTIMNIDNQGNLLSDTPIHNPRLHLYGNMFQRENSDIILMGTGQDSLYSDIKSEGWLIAHNAEFERLWQTIIIDQRYSPSGTNVPTRGTFWYGTETDNQNMIFIGEIHKEDPEAIFRDQVWIVKTDADGCIEPNCGFLQIIDSEGNYSTLSSTEEFLQSPTESLSIKLYPNPIEDVFRLDFSEAFSTSEKVTLWSLQGKSLREYSNVSSGTPLKLPEQLNSGMYLLRGQTDLGVWTKKIIVKQKKF